MAICSFYHQSCCTCGLGVANKHINCIAADNTLEIIQCSSTIGFGKTYITERLKCYSIHLALAIVVFVPWGVTRDSTSDCPGDLIEMRS